MAHYKVREDQPRALQANPIRETREIDFGGDEEIFVSDVRFLVRDSELGFGVVEIGTVKVVIS